MTLVTQPNTPYNFDYIGAFIRSYRQANGESLQSLSHRTAVSKSMIAHIESGQKTPTITVLAKLADAMGVRLGDLVEPPTSDEHYAIHSLEQSHRVSKVESPFVCHKLTDSSQMAGVDFYHFSFCLPGKTSFGANKAGTHKVLWLQQGELTLHLASKTVLIHKHQVITYKASLPHRFESRKYPLAEGTFVVTFGD